MILLGAIADDFRGATGLANAMVKGRMSTVQLIGTPHEDGVLLQADAAVTALKSRTASPGWAVEQSMKALRWLRRTRPCGHAVPLRAP